MSSVASRAVACALIVTVVHGSRADAQGTDHVAGARRAVQIAYARFDSVRAMLAADSIKLANLPVFRNYAGLVLRADSTMLPPPFVKRLDSAFTYTHTMIRRVIGVSADSLLAGTVAAALPEGERTNIDGRADRMGLHVRGNAHPLYATLDMRHPDSAELVGLFYSWAEDAAGRRLPAVIKHWSQAGFPLSGGGLLPYDGTLFRIAIAYPELWRACDAGSRSACRSALAIVPNNDTINAWFTPAQQREAVNRMSKQNYYARSSGIRPMMRACIDDHADSMCHQVLEHTFISNGVSSGSPTSAWTRRTLLRRAVERGGPEAFERLTHSAATEVAAALEETARLPVDSLVEEWRLAVKAARPSAPTPPRTEVAMSIGVGLLALGLALKRRPA